MRRKKRGGGGASEIGKRVRGKAAGCGEAGGSSVREHCKAVGNVAKGNGQSEVTWKCVLNRYEF